MGSLQLHYHGLSYSISVYRKLSDILSAMQVPPTGKGSLYIRPLLFGSGSVLGVSPAPEYTFLVFVSPVGNYFKVGQFQVFEVCRFKSYCSILAVRTGPLANRYVARSLSGSTLDIAPYQTIRGCFCAIAARNKSVIVVFNRRRTLLGSIILITMRKREKKQGRRKRKREKKKEKEGEEEGDVCGRRTSGRCHGCERHEVATSSSCYTFQEGLAPINLIVENEYHRACPGGTGGVKTIGNYASVSELVKVIKCLAMVLHNLLMSRRCGSLIFAGFKLLQGRVWERRSWGCISTALFFTYETTDGPFRGQDGVDNAVRLGATQ
ncbi:hypothetical protein B296_00031597 [Ensete ventricosum]|uniref:Uncharacterized protein n=1 Tax=Ensete ventricosum TaxID=4639 RepID=A0A427A7B8_ENSVE|nr:hypothetical protein B296_00031597 [Ensete ventricosum]